jgi:hypothetical protein
MKRIYYLVALAAAIVIGMSPPGLTQPQSAGYGDVTDTLGTHPYFANGYQTDQFGTWLKPVSDGTSGAPAALGKFLVYGSAGWVQSAIAGATLPLGAYGAVATAAAAVNGTATIVARGVAPVYCTTGSVAIAAGSELIADGSGNLTVPTPSGTPSSGSATPTSTASPAATVSYKLYARNAYALDSATSATISATSTTLSGAAPVSVTATVPAGTTRVVVVRSAGGPSQGVIGYAEVAPGNTVVNFLDFGQVAGAASYTANTVPVFPAGQVLGVAQAALTTSQSATLVNVLIGGF